MTKAYTVERWDRYAPSPCRLEGHLHARGTIGAWVIVLETGDLKEAGAVLKQEYEIAPARMTFNLSKAKIRP